jgi:hypothetical protein
LLRPRAADAPVPATPVLRQSPSRRRSPSLAQTCTPIGAGCLEHGELGRLPAALHRCQYRCIACVKNVNSVTTVTNALVLLVLLVLLTPVLGKRGRHPWPSCSPLVFLLGLLAPSGPFPTGLDLPRTPRASLRAAQHRRDLTSRALSHSRPTHLLKSAKKYQKCHIYHKCHCCVGSLVRLVSLQAGTGLTRTSPLAAFPHLAAFPSLATLATFNSARDGRAPRFAHSMAIAAAI